MAIIETINSAINSFVWGVPMLVLLVGAGILLTCRTCGVQFRKFGYAMKNTAGKIFKKGEAKEGEITPFQAMSTALAGTVGTGNIAGVTTALTLGGPGSMFWLWITALIGMATKYSEVLLAVKFRERNKDGDWVGGPMYYIKNGLGKNWKWLGAIFCIFAALAAFGIGNAVQVGNITSSINTVITSFSPDFAGQKMVNSVLGIILVILTAIVLFGGIKRLGAVTEKLVPFMAVIYIVACLVVVVYYAKTLPDVFASIFEGAFSPSGVTGGAVGSVILVITWGVKRGVFSNEAGLGSAPMAHASTSETDCVKQGLYGIFEVFVDTIVICTLSGLTVLCAWKGGALDLNIGHDRLERPGPGFRLHPEGRRHHHRRGPGAVRLLHRAGLGAVRHPLLRVPLRREGHPALSDPLPGGHLCGCDHEAGPGLGHRRHPQRPHGHPEPDRPVRPVRRGGQGDEAAFL